MTNGDKIKLRAELAGSIAAAIISTIKDDEDYWRLKHLAGASGLSVSQWVAKDSVKQADALMAELGLKVEE
ncbi:MAG: hypothetical protein [Caudoviricetes sp.]|nr:MAG: hypothetical protein [Caudoviricetes sp.]